MSSTLAVAWSNVWTHKLRSSLAVLMIAVGIGVVIAVVTVAAGIRLALLEGVAQFYRADLILLQGRVSGAELSLEIPRVFSERDARRIAELPDVRTVSLAGQLEGGTLSDRGQTLPLGRVMAASANLQEFFTLQDGRFPQGPGEVVLGNVLAETMRQPNPDGPVLGRVFSLKFLQGGQVRTEEVRVVGIFAQVPVGPEQFDLGGVRNDDAYVSFDYLTQNQIIDGQPVRFVEEMYVRVRLNERLQQTLEQMPDQIRQTLTEEGSDFVWLIGQQGTRTGRRTGVGFSSRLPLEEAARGIDDVVPRLAGFVSSIGAFALIVGVFGIVAIMIISVTERTREIGVLKAIGASSGAVMRLFLIEASILCVCGAVLASGLGTAASFFVKRLMALLLELKLEVPFVFLPNWYAGALLGGVLVGLLSGLYPAWRAARVDPIKALRHE